MQDVVPCTGLMGLGRQTDGQRVNESDRFRTSYAPGNHVRGVD